MTTYLSTESKWAEAHEGKPLGNVVFEQRFECARCSWVLAFTHDAPMKRIREHMETVHGGMPKARVVCEP